VFGLSKQNSDAESTQTRTDTMFFAFVLLLIVSGVTILAPFDFARANDCLPAPNSTAPKGTHWYFSLDRSTQKKCWYVRSSETQPQHARTQTNSAPVPAPSTSAEQADSTVTGGIDGPSGQLESSARVIHDPVPDAVPNRSASETVAQHNVQSPTLRENASIDANGQENATTSVALPDPPPMPPSVTTRATNMASVNAPMNPVSDITVSVAGNGERTSKFEIPIMIFPGLAFGLVVIGFGIREIMRDSESRL
jgi:hypothetical protein